MSYQHVLKCDLDPGGEVIRAQKSYTGTGHARIDESVANGQTDSQINVAIDVSAVKSIIILADQNVTLETNSGSTPADTISLVAGVPYVWNTDSYAAFVLGTDVTAIFITNASGAAARIQLDAVFDATP